MVRKNTHLHCVQALHPRLIAPFILFMLLWCFLPVASAAELERWLYCAQNLWVDKNIDTLEALLRREASPPLKSPLPQQREAASPKTMVSRLFI